MRLVERDADLERDQLRDPVDVAVRHAERAAHVAHDGFRRHRAVGHDLRDALATVTVRDVVDHAVAAVDAEVDVEVRQRHALGIQEPLEQQVVRERIQVRDAERVRDERADARAATGPDRDRVVARPRDEVGHDQEVAFEAHLADHFDLASKALAIAARQRPPQCRAAASRAMSPAAARCFRCSRGDVPSSTLKSGRNTLPMSTSSEQRFAISTVFATASGRSANSARHLGRRLQVLLLAVRCALAAGSSSVDALARCRRASRAPRSRRARGSRRRSSRPRARPSRRRAPRRARDTRARRAGRAAAARCRSAPAAARASSSSTSAARAPRPPPSALPSSPFCAPDRPINPSSAAELEPLLEQHVRPATSPSTALFVSSDAQALEARAVLAQQRAARRLAILARLGNPDVGADDRLHAALERELVELHERRDVALVRDRARRHALLRLRASTSASTRTTLSTSEYSVWTRRWTKPLIGHAYRRCRAPARTTRGESRRARTWRGLSGARPSRSPCSRRTRTAGNAGAAGA